jgi:hypothetical protein
MQQSEIKAQDLMDKDLILLKNIEDMPDESTWNGVENQKIDRFYNK